MGSREIVQIAVSPEGHLIALCSDSTIWIKKNDWIQVQDVPGLEHGDEEEEFENESQN